MPPPPGVPVPHRAPTAITLGRPHPLPPGPSGNSLPFAAWTNLTSSLQRAPSPRAGAGLVYDAADQYAVLFGGYDNVLYSSSYLLNDTWTFNGTWTNITTTSGTAPSPRQFMDTQMVYDAADGYVLLFGGSSNSGTFGDTWTFSAGKWTNLSSNLSVAPSPRSEANLAYDAYDREVVLFGGLDASGSYLAQTWVWKAGNWTLLHPSVAPPARRMSQMGYDASSGQVVLFSGVDSAGTAFTDTWGFRAGNWTRLHPASSPAGRWGGELTADAQDGYDLLYGGCTSIGCLTALNDTWAWKNGAWYNLSVDVKSSPFERAAFPVAEDAALGKMVEFGGSLPNPSYGITYMTNDTWTYGWPTLSARVVPSPASLDLGLPMNLSAVTTGGAGPLTGAWVGTLPGCLPASGAPLVCVPNATGGFSVAYEVSDLVLQQNTSPSVTVTVYPDPSVNVTWAPRTPEVGAPLTLWANTTGGLGNFTFDWRGLPPGCAGPSTGYVRCVPTGAGSFAVNVTATDSDGLRASQGPLALAIQPGAAVTVVASGTYGAAPFSATFAASSLGGFAPFGYRWEFGDGGTAQGARVSHTFLATGTDVVTVSETDAEGANASANVTVQVVYPLSVHLTVLPESSQLDLGQNLTLALTLAGGDGTYSVAWAGLPNGCTGGSAEIVRCLPVSAGNFSISARVSDSHGLATSVETSVVIHRPLSAKVDVGPPSGCGGSADVALSVNLTGGTPPFNVTWTFSDASGAANGSSVSHTFVSPGNYLVLASVADAAQSVAQAQGEVNLTAAPCSPTAPAGWFGLGPAGEWLVVGGIAVVVAAGLVVGLGRRRRREPPSLAGPEVGGVPPDTPLDRP